jgi:hypothetical protein
MRLTMTNWASYPKAENGSAGANDFRDIENRKSRGMPREIRSEGGKEVLILQYRFQGVSGPHADVVESTLMTQSEPGSMIDVDQKHSRLASYGVVLWP